MIACVSLVLNHCSLTAARLLRVEFLRFGVSLTLSCNPPSATPNLKEFPESACRQFRGRACNTPSHRPPTTVSSTRAPVRGKQRHCTSVGRTEGNEKNGIWRWVRISVYPRQ